MKRSCFRWICAVLVGCMTISSLSLHVFGDHVEEETVEHSSVDVSLTAEACKHSLVYKADGAVLVETCSKCDHRAEASLSVSDTTFTGKPIPAKVTYSDGWAGGTLTVTYKRNTGPGSAFAYLDKGDAQASLKYLIKAKTEMDLTKYLESSAITAATLKNSRYFNENKTLKFTDVQKVDFLDSLLTVSMFRADSQSYETVKRRIHALLYDATYRPSEFGGKTSDFKKWPIQNFYYGETGYKDVKSAKDTGLGYTVKWKTYCGGCLSYGRFCSVYVYRNEGDKHALTFTGTVNARSQFRKYLDPGETIYYNVANSEYAHSIIYLGESADGQGFYFLSYGGGKLTSSKSYHTLDIGYISFSNFYTLTKGCKVKFYDTNGGSYFEGTADKVSEIKSYGSISRISGTSVVGDINGDKKVDINDALLLFKHSMIPANFPITYDRTTDFCLDGVLDINDSMRLFRHSVLPNTYPIS